ncbi:V-type ATP synthase subunit E [uncultured Peptoniphilus sp.]|uniref:V-type ATP synthase subunit E n=1 Tax=uncultured Peptoniphilus sp. TaxID=254354 RepID=UPI002803EA8D|nr:V-type ATP synthase subunit E [uncultured Peptoniphilus sp.]
MPGIDTILKKIKEDAEIRAKEILDEAKAKRDKIVSDKKAEGESLSERIGQKAKEDEESIISKAKSSAELKARDEVLMAKEKIINRVLELVKESLNNLGPNEYISYLKSSLKNLNLSDKDILQVPEKYYESVKNADIGIKIDEEFTQSGFILRKENLIYNGDFSSIVDSMKEDLMPYIAEEVFKK